MVRIKRRARLQNPVEFPRRVSPYIRGGDPGRSIGPQLVKSPGPPIVETSTPTSILTLRQVFSYAHEFLLVYLCRLPSPCVFLLVRTPVFPFFSLILRMQRWKIYSPFFASILHIYRPTVMKNLTLKTQLSRSSLRLAFKFIFILLILEPWIIYSMLLTSPLKLMVRQESTAYRFSFVIKFGTISRSLNLEMKINYQRIVKSFASTFWPKWTCLCSIILSFDRGLCSWEFLDISSSLLRQVL